MVDPNFIRFTYIHIKDELSNVNSKIVRSRTSKQSKSILSGERPRGTVVNEDLI